MTFLVPDCRCIKVGKLVYKDQKAFSKMLIFIEICGLIAAIHVRSIASPLPPSPECTAVVVSHQQEWQFLWRLLRSAGLCRMARNTYPSCPKCSHFWFIPPFWWSTFSGSLLRKCMWKTNLEGPWISVFVFFFSTLHLIDASCEILGRKYFQNLRLFLHGYIASGFVAQRYFNILMMFVSNLLPGYSEIPHWCVRGCMNLLSFNVWDSQWDSNLKT